MAKGKSAKGHKGLAMLLARSHNKKRKGGHRSKARGHGRKHTGRKHGRSHKI